MKIEIDETEWCQMQDYITRLEAENKTLKTNLDFWEKGDLNDLFERFDKEDPAALAEACLTYFQAKHPTWLAE